MKEELKFLLSPLSILKGFGEKTIFIYKRLLISKRIFDQKEPKIIDLLYHKPEKVIHRLQNPNLLAVKDSDVITTKVVVESVEKPFKYGQPFKILCSNTTGFITIIYFGRIPEFLINHFEIGSEITISGKVERFNNALQMTHPDYIDNQNIPEFEQVYPLTAGLSNRILRQNIQNILKNIPDLPEWLDSNFLFEKQWKSWKESIIGLHNIQNENQLEYNIFKERLAFDELLANQIALCLIREKIKQKTNKEGLKNKDKKLKDIFLKSLPFELTNDQKKVISEIENDIYSNKRMLRLLQGDVGSGKTIVAFLTMLPYVENKKQSVLMVPTSVLANQHYEKIKKLCENQNINVGLLTGKIKGKKREKILEELKNGTIDILIGTHAVFQEKVEFKNLSYVVIDEQHRFGVIQRLNLIEKGEDTDTLIMTATPIPRTLALTIYGDMEISTIKEKPKNRKEIITTSLQKENFNELVFRIKERIKNGEKIYWICPLIEESENIEATPLYKRYEEFKKIFNEREIGFIHGKMTEDEKDKIMVDFNDKEGDIKILIATSVIEVGIDVPDATIIIIESPERFGLSQMHQLRGRVGRGDKQSYCILFYEKLTQNLKKRIEILKSSSDGFYIAEEDLKLRGSGEVIGIRQSGYQEYLIADLSENYELLIKASKMARNIVKNQDLLNSHPIQLLLEMFGYDGCLNGVILN